ncbi:MAG: hypothetical protein ACK4HR_04660 [Hyphomonas sp.]|jgi:hypothetical protein
MLHPSTKRLIDKLSEMTRKQRVAWTEGENGTVIHDTEGYRVVLTPEPHALLLTDGMGREIETCRPEEFADEVDAQGRPYAKFVGELYREAHRHARGAEKAIRTLLAGLDATEAELAPAPMLPEPPAIIPVLTADVPDATTDETAPLAGESETEITHAVASLANQINSVPQTPIEVQPAVTAAEAPVLDVQTAPAPPEPEPLSAAALPEPETVLQAATAPQPEPMIEPAPAQVPEPDVKVAAEPVEEEWIVKGAAPEPMPAPAEEPGAFGTFAAFQPATPEPEPAAVAATELAAEPEPEPLPAAPTLAQPISLSSIPMGFGLGAAQRLPTPPSPRPLAEPEPGPVAAEAPRRIIIDGTLDLPPLPQDAFPYLPGNDPYPPSAPEARPGDVPSEETPAKPDAGSVRRFNPWN